MTWLKFWIRRYFYKNIELTVNLNKQLKFGVEGVVLEIIDKDKVFAEFYESKGETNWVEWWIGFWNQN